MPDYSLNALLSGLAQERDLAIVRAAGVAEAIDAISVLRHIPQCPKHEGFCSEHARLWIEAAKEALTPSGTDETTPPPDSLVH